MIEVTGNLVAEDYVRAQFLNMRPKWVYKVLGALVLLLVFWATWHTFFGSDDPFVMADLILPAAIAYLTLFFLVYIPWKARRVYKQQKSLQRELTLRFEDAGLSAKNEMAAGTTPWPDFIKWKENSHLFLLYVSDCLYIMVPKRIISDPKDVDQIRKTLLAKIGGSAA